MGAILLSGCGSLDSSQEGLRSDRQPGQRSANNAQSTEVPGTVTTPIVGDVTTSGGGTNVAFPVSTQPTHQPPAGPDPVGEIYGSRTYRYYGQNDDPRINVAAHSEEPEASSAAPEGQPGHPEGESSNGGH